jgi:hypothetical protein
MKLFKKMDIVIIICLMVLSFLPHFIFAKNINKNYDSIYATIKVDGEIYRNVQLSLLKDNNEFTIETSNGNNTILVKDKSISITHADCHDSLCVKQGVKSKVGDTIVCLPHKLVIEIKGKEEDSSSDDIILSY